MNQGIRQTYLFVGVSLIIVAIWLIFKLAGPLWGIPCLVWFGFEISRLTNKYRDDTISEIIWRLCAYPIFAFFCGGLFVYTIERGLIVNPYLISIIAIFLGHFFFQAQKVYRELWVKDVFRRRQMERDNAVRA